MNMLMPNITIYNAEEICHRKRSDVKYRRMYNYIDCEYENVLCCGECEVSIIEDGML